MLELARSYIDDIGQRHVRLSLHISLYLLAYFYFLFIPMVLQGTEVNHSSHFHITMIPVDIEENNVTDPRAVVCW